MKYHCFKMKVKETHSSTKQIQSSTPAIGARVCYRLAHQGIRLVVIKIKQAQQGWKLKWFSVACKERNIVGTESCCNTVDEDSTPAGIMFPNSLWRGLSVVREHDELLKEVMLAPNCAVLSNPLTSSVMLKVISWKAHFLSEREFGCWGGGWWCEKNPVVCGICFFFCLIFYFLLFWSESPRENFVGNFSGSLPVIREQIFLLKKTRKGLIVFLALPWIGTFCHSLITLHKKTPEKLDAWVIFRVILKSLSPPVF